VDIADGAYEIKVEFGRNVIWTLPNGQTIREQRTTWQEHPAGRDDKSAAIVLSQIEERVEKFINAYVKANE
jgi:hypothetical protein